MSSAARGLILKSVTFFVLTVVLLVKGANANTEECYKYLAIDTESQLPIGVTRIESLFGRNTVVRDVTDFVEESIAYTDRALISQVLSN